MKSRAKFGLAIATTSLLVLTGCTQTATGGDSAGTDGPIKIMTIGPIDTTIQNYPDAEAGARAAVEAINADGGVGGRSLEWEFCNQKSDPNESSACARQAESDEVVAVVGQVDAFSTSSLPLLEKAGIASYGLHSVGNEVDWDSPISYPFHGGAPVAHVAALDAIKQQGGSRIQVVAVEVAASTNQIALQEQGIKRAGLEHAGTVTIPVSGVSDYAPFAQQIVDNRADGVVFLSSAGVSSAMIQAINDLGHSPVVGYNAFSFPENQVVTLGDDAENLFLASPYPSFRDTQVEAIQQFNDELDAIGIAEDPQLRSTVGFNAWLAVHTFADQVESMDGPISSKTFKEHLDSVGEINLMGVMDWNPSEMGTSTNPDYPRIPPTALQFLSLNEEGHLTLRKDLKSVSNVMEGISR
jgi:ABC-type branched-subunit amino acid transport system substrate-binding protein